MTIDELVKVYKYKPLPPSLSDKQQAQYLAELPPDFELYGDENCSLYANNVKVSNGYSRIVIGDYGAYVEIPPSLIIKDNIRIKTGQEYRLTEEYKNVKYLWLCVLGAPKCKVYLQRHSVSYADYIPGMYYIAPSELEVKKHD